MSALTSLSSASVSTSTTALTLALSLLFLVATSTGRRSVSIVSGLPSLGVRLRVRLCTRLGVRLSMRLSRMGVGRAVRHVRPWVLLLYRLLLI